MWRLAKGCFPWFIVSIIALVLLWALVTVHEANEAAKARRRADRPAGGVR